jgi:multiple sugar transport system permease protein
LNIDSEVRTGRARLLHYRTHSIPYFFIAPALLLLLVFGLFPIVVALFISSTDMNIAGLANWSNVNFIGISNYTKLFGDPDFRQAMFTTGFFVLVGVPTVVFLSLSVALLLNRSDSRFFRVLRSFYFIPSITGIVAISLIWGYLYNTQFGLLNWILSLLHLQPIQWLSNPLLAKFSVALVAVWRGTGLNIIIFLAALKAIPREYLEAAAIDGAGELTKIFRITLPLLRFALFFVTITTTIAWLQFFDETYVITKGGPLGATTSISLFIFNEGFSQNQFGYASAGSVVLFLVISGVTLVQLRRRGQDVEY